MDNAAVVTWGLGIGGLACGVIFNFIATRWGKRIDNQRLSRHDIVSAEIAERAALISNWDSLVKSLQARLGASDLEYHTLLELFGRTQEALELCNQGRRNDATIIATQSERIRSLEVAPTPMQVRGK